MNCLGQGLANYGYSDRYDLLNSLISLLKLLIILMQPSRLFTYQLLWFMEASVICLLSIQPLSNFEIQCGRRVKMLAYNHGFYDCRNASLEPVFITLLVLR